ncbi:hypothetical protein [Litorimonas sp. WD9-15]|uniref:hypothetical protein n=1 Tax=Litorimonas sp. WD9-15 TaxID=3418716 RepID=UPI003D017AC3
MKPPKKSETLEIRLSHPDKTALQIKASREGRTVSDVVRGLISVYIAEPDTRSTSTKLTELLMTLKSKPKSALATAAACVALPFAIVPFAAAEPIALKLDGEYIEPVVENGTEGTRTRRFDTEIHVETGDSYEFIVGGSDPFSLTLSVTEVGDELLIDMKIYGGEDFIGHPKVKTQINTPVRIEIGHDDGQTFTMNALPTRQ